MNTLARKSRICCNWTQARDRGGLRRLQVPRGAERIWTLGSERYGLLLGYDKTPGRCCVQREVGDDWFTIAMAALHDFAVCLSNSSQFSTLY